MSQQLPAPPLAPLQKPVELVRMTPPPPSQQRRREARFAAPGERRTRYTLPDALNSDSPLGYRTRVSLTEDEGRLALSLLSMERPQQFMAASPPTEGELFEECALGILSSRQSTNHRGFRQVTFGPSQQARLNAVLDRLMGRESPLLSGATHTHVVLSQPYRTPFTLLLTLVGHRQATSPLTVAGRIWRKRLRHESDLPSIDLLPALHLGILADGMERAAVIASQGRRQAQVLARPFCRPYRTENRAALRQLEDMCGLSLRDRMAGWRVALVAQVGAVPNPREAPADSWRKLGANLLALRSERIQPGVNNDDTAPETYRHRQDMDVPEALTEQAGRAAFNAFCHWTGVDRDEARKLLLLERVDVLTPHGKERLRQIRAHLEEVTDRVIRELPWWAELATGKAFSRNAERGRKAFGLAGQRIYIGGLSRPEVDRLEVPWELAVRAMGAAAARSALVAEISGLVNLPSTCDLLAGVCLMAGPVNQNDIAKTYYGGPDLLASAFPGRMATSLLVWTLKAKTVADPVGNEEQLLNPARKGALVELRPAPHEVCFQSTSRGLQPLRWREGRTNGERAFGDVGNFVTDPEGRHISGNAGEPWPESWRQEAIE